MSANDQPECIECGDEIEDETGFVRVGGGTVHRGEPQGDAGGGICHPDCAKQYIDDHWS